MQKLIKQSLVGVGQIFLQENGLTGLIITFAMFFSHWTLGITCFLGALIGTLIARTLKYPAEQIQQGLYGFNASLAFMCVMFTFGEVDASNPIVWLLGIVASIVSTLLMREFTKRNKVAFTFPFVVTSWIFCWGVAKLGLFGLIQTTPALPDLISTVDAIHEPFYAWAEVNFGANVITGALLFLAIAINTPIAAVYGLAAASVGAAFAYHILDIDQNTLANGIYGFSPVLVACTFAGTQLRDFIIITTGVILAVSIQYAITATGIATYTIGFIVASWIMLAVKAKWASTNLTNHWVKVLNP